jgi:hypothetical protein
MFLLKRKIDIHSKRRGVAGRLSNFTRRDFVFDGVPCRSIEGVLQSLKYENVAEQKIVCGLWGIQAKLAGEPKNNWKNTQTLYWNSKAYKRESAEYRELITSLYRAVYEQDEQFKKDIRKTKGRKLIHSIGNPDPTDTVLTEKEFLSQLINLQGE